MTAQTALTNIAEMIDLSIGTPENGTVDFVMLHTVLHCLAQQLRCTEKIVEVRGPLAVFPVGRQEDDALTVVVDELLINPDGQAAGPDEEDKTILVVERLPKNQRVQRLPKNQRVPLASPSSLGTTSSSIRAEMSEEKGRRPAGKGTRMRKITVAGAGGGVEEIAEGYKDSGDEGVGGAEEGGAKEATEEALAAPGAVGTAQGFGGGTGGPIEEGTGAVAVGASAVAGGAPGETAGTPGKVTAGSIGPTGSAQRLAVSAGERLSLVSLNKFNQLQKSVDDLKSRVYGTTPNNVELLEGVRSQTNLKGITDMWTSLNVSSRLEAAEAGIAKLSSLMQDLIAKDALLKKEGDTGIIGTLPQPITVAAEGTVPLSSGMPPECATKEELSQVVDYLKSLQDEIDHLSGEFYNAMQEMDHRVAEPPAKQEIVLPTVVAPTETAPPSDSQLTTPIATQATTPIATQATTPSATQATTPVATQATTPVATQATTPVATEATTPVATEVTTPVATEATTPIVTPAPSTMPIAKPAPVKVPIPDKKRPVAPPPTGGAVGDPNQKIAALNGKLKDLERKVNDILQVVFPANGNILTQLNALQDQVEKNVRQFAEPASCSDGGPGPSPELLKDLQGLMTLYKTVHNMQSQLKEVHDTALQLATEKEERQLNINSLLEQIELLKAIKLDREDMAMALADKADLRLVARKVSHDQFEMACDDLAKGLEQALGKLNVQESLWQQALDDIQREIEMKLDKVELGPIKDFFLKKMKLLQDNLKQMASLRREAEAAGTKSKLLKDVNCISCDAQAYMQTEAGPAAGPKPLQPTMSMRPYLTYELDAIRKSQASNVPQRNMHDWEKIEKQMTTPKTVKKVRSETDKHICNRYCGGSHTTTTPAQRVARLGHFVKQWGPEVLPLASGFATGDDGKMYKVSEVENASVGPGGAIDATCTPKPAAKKDKPPSKPTLTPDCRCLDDVLPPRK